MGDDMSTLVPNRGGYSMSLILLIAALVCFVISSISAFNADVLAANFGGFLALGLVLFVGGLIAEKHGR